MSSMGLPRVVLISSVIFTAFPLIAVAGIFCSLIGMALGFGTLFKGKWFKGILMLFTAAGAFYGLVTLCELLVHFWRTPRTNPSGRAFVRNAVGLAFGWSATTVILVAAWRANDHAYAYVGLGGLLTIPTAALVSIWFILNHLRQPR